MWRFPQQPLAVCCLVVASTWWATTTISVVSGLDNGLARTPPMGWLTWERFRCNVDCQNFPADCIAERLILETADHLADDGWLQAGYQYITIDDCWPEYTRAPNGSLVPNQQRFPHGMGFVADYVHKKGLRFGIYEDFGTKTCGGYPGSEFYMALDTQTFADWGVDLIKLDGCYSDASQQAEGYEIFQFYMNRTGRPMVFSCSYPAYNKMPDIDTARLKKNCNMWRMFDDIDDSWDSVLHIVNYYKGDPGNLSSLAGPGHWNDPDMLIIGDYGLSLEQQRVQMGMWAIFAAPLIMSVDLRTIRPESRAILQNPRLISINQDVKGQQGTFVKEADGLQLWRRSVNNSVVAAVLNTNTDTPRRFLLNLTDLTLPAGQTKFTLYEVFSGDGMGDFQLKDLVPLLVNPTGIAMVYVI